MCHRCLIIGKNFNRSKFILQSILLWFNGVRFGLLRDVRETSDCLRLIFAEKLGIFSSQLTVRKPVKKKTLKLWEIFDVGLRFELLNFFFDWIKTTVKQWKVLFYEGNRKRGSNHTSYPARLSSNLDACNLSKKWQESLWIGPTNRSINHYFMSNRDDEFCYHEKFLMG